MHCSCQSPPSSRGTTIVQFSSRTDKAAMNASGSALVTGAADASNGSILGRKQQYWCSTCPALPFTMPPWHDNSGQLTSSKQLGKWVHSVAGAHLSAASSWCPGRRTHYQSPHVPITNRGSATSTGQDPCPAQEFGVNADSSTCTSSCSN